MVKCPSCGEILSQKDKRCPKCGYKLTKNVADTSKKGPTNKIIAIIAIVVIIAIVAVIASGIFSNDNAVDDTSANNDNSDVVAPISEDDSQSSAGDSQKTAESTEYWASAKADKFHLPTCEWAEKISDDNKIVYQSRDDAIADGKEPCGVCNP